MAVYTLEVATEFNYPNLTVYKVLCDGVQIGWRVIPNEGYVMYDTTADNKEAVFDPETGDLVIDPETGLPVEVSVIWYYTSLDRPLNASWVNFPWVAVPRDSVDENYIFGVDDNDYEVM